MRGGFGRMNTDARGGKASKAAAFLLTIRMMASDSERIGYGYVIRAPE
jgi:hypothetical protein